MNGWHESIKDQTPDHPDHAKPKPGLAKRLKEANAAHNEATKVRNEFTKKYNDEPRGFDYITDSGLIDTAEANVKADSALARQQRVNK